MAHRRSVRTPLDAPFQEMISGGAEKERISSGEWPRRVPAPLSRCFGKVAERRLWRIASVAVRHLGVSRRKTSSFRRSNM
jgi:hypothetical protein